MQIDIVDIQKRIAEQDKSAVRALLPFERGVTDKGEMIFTMSEEVTDRHGTIVRLGEGANIEEYRKNPILLWMHESSKGMFSDSYNPDLVLGYTDTFIEGGKLKAIPYFESEETTGNALADKIKKKIEFGSLRGVSIGFIPVSGSMGEKSRNEDESVFYIRDWTLLENSIVTIPSNPNGLIENAAEKVLDQEIEEIIETKEIEKETQDQDNDLPTRNELARAKRILTLIKLRK